jgi:hypothetical protein
VPAQTRTTIDEALSAFLAEQRERLSARTFRNCADVIQLLRHSLDGYAHSSLDEDELRRFEQAFDAGDEHARHRPRLRAGYSVHQEVLMQRAFVTGGHECGERSCARLAALARSCRKDLASGRWSRPDSSSSFSMVCREVAVGAFIGGLE